MDSVSPSSFSIAGLITATLASIGASGCASDEVPDDQTTTTYGGTDSSMDSAMETAMDTTESGTVTESGTDSTTTYTDESYYDPCAGWGPQYVPIEVTDWIVTSMSYDSIRMAAEQISAQEWNLLDETARCMYACAFASNNLYALMEPYGYLSLDIATCMLAIPTVDADGVLQCSGTLIEDYPCPGGRAPLGWEGWRVGSNGPRHGRELDAMATMEAVSITAFEELAEQLGRLGAPLQLVERCRAAARDEAHHLALLERLGGHGPAGLPTPAAADTSVLAIALHNAVEGCVNETWAALLARHQSQHASHADTRRVFGQIADDETRHAQLAWELHAWLCERLSSSERTCVEATRARAIDALARVAWQQALAVPTVTRAELGLPEPRLARALARHFGEQLASAA
jgi:hypothetical protein